jgi:MFS family permease
VSRRELLRNRGLLGLLARDVVSMTGSQMTWLALPWFVLTTTGSPARMGVVLAVESASLAVFGFLSGNVVARLGPRRTMLIADAVRARSPPSQSRRSLRRRASSPSSWARTSRS